MIMYEHIIKVAIAIQNALKVLADLEKILILLENLVFARGEIIFWTTPIGDFWMIPSCTVVKYLLDGVSDSFHRF